MKAERSGRTALPVRTRFGIGAFAFSLTMRCTADAQNTHEDLMHTIETDRLLLRNFTPDDAADLFDYLHAPGAACFLSLRLEDRDAARREAEKRSRDDEHVAVCLKATGRLVGDLFAVPDGEPDTLSVGWHFNARFGGVGLATEAARALFADLFEARGARRLFAYVEEDNIPSQRLCERLGMRHEGTFKEFVSFEQDAEGHPIFVDTRQYALLRKEWARRAVLHRSADA